MFESSYLEILLISIYFLFCHITINNYSKFNKMRHNSIFYKFLISKVYFFKLNPIQI